MQRIVNTLFPIVKRCVVNQTWEFWLLLNVFIYVFTLCIAMNIGVAIIEALNNH
jgi:hypothetical protein